MGILRVSWLLSRRGPLTAKRNLRISLCQFSFFPLNQNNHAEPEEASISHPIAPTPSTIKQRHQRPLMMIILPINTAKNDVKYPAHKIGHNFQTAHSHAMKISVRGAQHPPSSNGAILVPKSAIFPTTHLNRGLDSHTNMTKSD